LLVAAAVVVVLPRAQAAVQAVQADTAQVL
jgi:hypothetical protein